MGFSMKMKMKMKMKKIVDGLHLFHFFFIKLPKLHKVIRPSPFHCLRMELNSLVERLPHVSSSDDAQLPVAASLLNHVHAEFQDHDGDRATDFILADSLPNQFSPITTLDLQNPSFQLFDPSNSGRKRPFLEDVDSTFICTVCALCVPLESLGSDLSCSCLCCVPCLRKHIEACVSRLTATCEEGDDPDHRSCKRMFDSLNCPSCACERAISLSAIQALAPEASQKWHEEANEVLFQTSDFVRCPGCAVMIEKVIGDIPAGVMPSGVPEFDKTPIFIELDDNGKPMSRAALLHKFSNFFRCSLCKLGFCSLCLTSPYHLGYTCQEYEDLKNAIRCRYCEAPIIRKESDDKGFSSITVRNLRRDLDRKGVDATWCVEKRELLSVRELVLSVCDAKDCRERLNQACTRSLECGHHCGGLRGERVCLPCLEENCRGNRLLYKAYLPSADDFCSICMVEALRSAPSIQLKCGHIVHFECAKKQLKEGFPGPEISFGYLNCSHCMKRMEHESLVHDMLKSLDLLNLVKEKAMKRLKMEKKKSSIKRFEKLEPEELETYAMHKYQYYICCKCKNPYFGGIRDCAADLGLQHNGNGNLHNPLELVCGGCSAAFCRHTTCTKGHGSEYVEFKCRYCCAVATYFCFGRIHFCSSCHVTRPDADPKFIPKKCVGPRSCPLKVAHAPNGEEWCLGCSMCRLLSQ